MARLYKVTTVFEVTETEVLEYLGYSADSDYEPTDDEWQAYVDEIVHSEDLEYEITPIA